MKVWVHKSDKMPGAPFRLLLSCWRTLDYTSKVEGLAKLFPEKDVRKDGSLYIVGGGMVVIDSTGDGKDRSDTHRRYYVIPKTN